MMTPGPTRAGDMAILGWFPMGVGEAEVYHLYAQVRAVGRTTWNPICSWSVRPGLPRTRTTASGQRFCLDCLERVTDAAPIG